MKCHYTPQVWLKLKRPTTPSVGEDMEQMKLLSCCKDYKSCHLFGARLAISYKVKQIFTMQPSNSTPVYLYMSNKIICSHKDLYTNVQSSVLHWWPIGGFIFFNHYELMNLNIFNASQITAVNICNILSEVQILHVWPVVASSL